MPQKASPTGLKIILRRTVDKHPNLRQFFNTFQQLQSTNLVMKTKREHPMQLPKAASLLGNSPGSRRDKKQGRPSEP